MQKFLNVKSDTYNSELIDRLKNKKDSESW